MCERNILRKQSQFTVLPNELIYFIFEYLTPADILRAFAEIDEHYADCVRFYIKQVDLTNDWQWDRQQLQCIYKMIEKLKVDRFHIYLLEDLISTSIKMNSPRQNKKLSWRSVVSKMFTPLHKLTTSSQSFSYDYTAVPIYRLPRLRSLHLVNIYHWSNVVLNMNLTSLTLSFDDNIPNCYMTILIPQTVTQFSTNISMDVNIFHTNLIDLNIYVHSIVYLLEIVKRTPNVQHLHVIFGGNVHARFHVENYQFIRFETMITNFRRLNNLNHLSFATKHEKDAGNNECLSFDQIQLFIDQCCPDTVVLKRVTLKLHYIRFKENIWSTIVRYKKAFDRFDFYTSFIVEDQTLMAIMISLINDLFDYYIEDGDPLYSKHRLVHIYSMPFDFDELHGFISCSELSSQSSFTGVRHLYFTQTCLNRPISFKSLTKRMPYLTSITCNFFFNQQYNITVPVIFDNEDIFHHVHFLHFISHCWHTACPCRKLLPKLLHRMPCLQSLTTSVIDFLYDNYPLPPIKRLDLQQCDSNSFDILEECLAYWSTFSFHVMSTFDILAKRLPYLSTIVLDEVPTCTRRLSRLLTAVFLWMPSMKLVSFRDVSMASNDPTQNKQKAKKALTQVQKMDRSLRHLKLDYEFGPPAFYLQNL
jgi:hypothetical protein